MKKFILFFTLIISVISVSARSNYSHNVADLPVAAQTTLKNNFKASLSHIKIEKDFGKVSEYDVILTDGSEITFDRNGNWKEIEVKNTSSIPSALIPVAIDTYVKNNQKKVKITGIEKSRSGYEVELSNGVEMKFDLNGKFLRYDQ